jgi:RHS repeat-associated protein
VYDFENRLVQRGGVTVVYDGDGSRVKETVAGVTTSYLVADQNPTGYAQVLDELQNGAVTRTYSYGLELINERQSISGTLTTSFYGYDGHCSVRFLTDSTGSITDTYDYDAFGNLISSTGTTPNNYLFAGEQFDPALGIYYNRARYYDQRQGRFWTMDTFEGGPHDPLSLHKYLYASGNPITGIDPTGHDDIGELMTAAAINVTLTTLSNVLVTGIFLGATASPNVSFDGALLSIHGNFSGSGYTLEGGVDFLWQKRTNSWFFSITGGLGTNPLGTLPNSTAGKGLGGSISLGPVFNMSAPNDMAGASVTAIWPSSILHLIGAAGFSGNKAWGVLSQFAKNVHNVQFSHWAVGLGVSSSGSPFASFAFRNNTFGTFAFDNSDYFPVSGSGIQGLFNDMRSRLGTVFSLVEGGAFSSSDAMSQSADQILGGIMAGDNAVQ